MKTVISVIAILLALLLAGCTNTESTPNGGVYRRDDVCRALHCDKQNKGGYARLTLRGAEILRTAKNDCTAVKLAQEGKFKRWCVKTAKGQ